jgi:hypothetical protein
VDDGDAEKICVDVDSFIPHTECPESVTCVCAEEPPMEEEWFEADSCM